MRKHGVEVDEIRFVDHDIATGVWPDMREHGWETDEWPAMYPGILASDILVVAGPDLARRQLLADQEAHRADLLAVGRAQRQGPVPVLRPGRGLHHHRQRGRHQALRPERPLQPPARRLHDPSQRGRRLDRRGRPRAVVPGPGQRRPRERLHQPQHHLHDVEPDAPGEAAARTPAACPATATSGRSGTPAPASTGRTPSTGHDRARRTGRHRFERSADRSDAVRSRPCPSGRRRRPRPRRCAAGRRRAGLRRADRRLVGVDAADGPAPRADRQRRRGGRAGDLARRADRAATGSAATRRCAPGSTGSCSTRPRRVGSANAGPCPSPA